MTKCSGFRKSLLGLIFAATVIGCNLIPSQRDTSGERSAEKTKLIIKEDTNSTNLKKMSKVPWTNVAEYDVFVRSTVDKYYASDIKEIYDFYNIKKDFPKYGFKQNPTQFTGFDCEGAVFKEKADSIYFYSSCLEELFDKYTKYLNNREEDPEIKLTNKLHHSIKHEAGHDIYCELGKEIGKTDLFKEITDATPPLERIQYSLVEEGVADYISYKGELTKSAKEFIDKNYKPVIFTDENFKNMVEKEDDSQLYELGFRLVKPILDIDFEKGIKELINHPLTKKDLNDLPAYRERRIEHLLQTLEEG